MPSAIDLMRSSLTLQPNLFQEFQPMGGVRARPLSSAREVSARERRARKSRNQASKAAVNVFIGAPPHLEKSAEMIQENGSERLDRSPVSIGSRGHLLRV